MLEFLHGRTSDRKLRLYPVATGKGKATLKGHTEGVASAAFSQDGKTLASGSEDTTMKLWDMRAAKQTDK
jgi:WD40 repeat protein